MFSPPPCPDHLAGSTVGSAGPFWWAPQGARPPPAPRHLNQFLAESGGAGEAIRRRIPRCSPGRPPPPGGPPRHVAITRAGSRGRRRASDVVEGAQQTTVIVCVWPACEGVLPWRRPRSVPSGAGWRAQRAYSPVSRTAPPRPGRRARPPAAAPNKPPGHVPPPCFCTLAHVEQSPRGGRGSPEDVEGEQPDEQDHRTVWRTSQPGVPVPQDLSISTTRRGRIAAG